MEEVGEGNHDENILYEKILFSIKNYNICSLKKYFKSNLLSINKIKKLKYVGGILDYLIFHNI